MEIAPDRQGAILSWRIRLENKSGRPRRLRLTSFCEIAGHETGAYARDLDFAGMHVETMFVRALNAILARNRLLRSARAGSRRNLVLRGEAGRRDGTRRLRGLAHPFYRRRVARRVPPAASRGAGASSTTKASSGHSIRRRVSRFEATLAEGAAAETEFIVGRSDNAVWASELIARRLGLDPLPEPDLQTRLYETRAVEPSPALPSRWPFGFSPDGKALRLTHRTPRPWAHVMANELGMATMVSNDGEIFSAFGNARQNGLSAFRFDSVTAVQPGQIVYLRDLDTGETDAPGFAPFQRQDADVRGRL